MDYSTIGFLGQMCVVAVAIAIASVFPVLTGLIVYGIMIWLEHKTRRQDDDR